MSFVPSVRECQHQLDRMRDTPQIVADLERLNVEVWREEGGCIELNAAIPRLRELHQLCLHMAANMSGGLGVPPTPPSVPARKSTTGTTGIARPPVTHWTRTAQPAAPKPTATPAASAPRAEPSKLPIEPHLRTVQQLCTQMKRSESWIALRMLDEGFPQPVSRAGRVRLWDAREVQRWIDARPAGQRKHKAIGAVA